MEQSEIEEPEQRPQEVAQQRPQEAEQQRQREAAPQPVQSGLLLTLRRLFRAEPEGEPGTGFQTTQDAPREAPAAPPVTPTPQRPSEPRRAAESLLPGEVAMGPAVAGPPVMRSAAEEPLTLARPRTVHAADGPGETVEPAFERSAATVEPDKQTPAATRAEGEGALTLPERQRQASAAGDAPSPLRRIARQRSEQSPPAIRRRPPATAATPAATAPSLVYLARKPAAVAERAPDGMATYEVPREQLSLMGYRTNAERAAQTATISRAVTIEELETTVEAEPAGPDGAPAPGEAPSAQISLDNLARQVYDKIRTRLRIERERSGLSSGAMSR
jgi:hypothetical protein